MKRLAVPAEVEAGGTVRMDIGVLEGRGQDSARDAADLTARVAQEARLVDLQITEPDIEEIVRRIYSAGN